MSSTASSAPAASAAPTGRGRRFVHGLLCLCAWSYLVVALGLWALLQWVDPWWPASIFLFAPPWLCALPLLVLIPGALLLWRKALLIPLALAAIVIAVPVSGLCIPWRTLLSPTPAGLRLRVLTCNLHGGRAVDPLDLEAYLLESGADVVALQECPTEKTKFVGAWPGWHRHATSRLLLASQYPIQRAIELGGNSDEPKGSVTRYDLDTPAGVVHFFSLHLASPRDSIYETIHDNRNGDGDIADNSARRRQQSQYVARQACGLTGPIVLAGDFNTPPASALFREVWSNYTDAFAAAGWGWGYTFTGARTTVRIDHILLSNGWACRRSWVGPSIGSPHRPVLADLVWTKAPAAGHADAAPRPQ